LLPLGLLAAPVFTGCGGAGRSSSSTHQGGGDASGAAGSSGGSSGDDGGVGGNVAEDAGPVGPAITVSFSTAGRHQKLVGFGAAAAYYTNYLADRSIDGDDVYDVLFVDLGLDILRIGNWYQMQRASGTTVNTAFNDNATVTIVQKATAAMGHAPKLLMSAWSPPAYLKSTGVTKPMTACDAGTCQGTLVRNALGAFAYDELGQWWVAALQAYASRGVVPDYISVQNEPDFFSNTWETCRLDPAEGANAAYGLAVDAVYAAVRASTLASKPIFVGPETSGQRRLTNDLASVADPAELGAIAHHLYNGGGTGNNPAPDSFTTLMTTAANAAIAAQKPVFVTEYSPPVPAMFETAWLIHNALTVEGASAYVYWELFWAAPTNGVPGALVTLDNPTTLTTPPGYHVNDMYYAVKHFAKWTDPDYVRIDATASDPLIKVSGFVAPDESVLTLVVLNTDASNARTVQLDASGYTFGTEAIFRTSGSVERTASIPVADDNSLLMPARSIATVTFTR
jgi:glucuronoarabinoxylan endo-1,4-beta-xylanase